jgi:hypothetical protein
MPSHANVRVLACIENHKFPVLICVSRTERERERKKRKRKRERLYYERYSILHESGVNDNELLGNTP